MMYQISNIMTNYLRNINTKFYVKLNYKLITFFLIILLFTCAVKERYYREPFVSKGNISPSNPYGDKGVQRLPHVIIPGIMKSGTRATINFLKMHPDICIASGEVRFFNTNAAYRKGLSFYRQQMPFSNGHNKRQITIEKSPEYFEDYHTPERIKAMNSSIKIVIVMRDPITRAVSDYSRTIRALATYGLDFSFVSFEVRN